MIHREIDTISETSCKVHCQEHTEVGNKAEYNRDKPTGNCHLVWSGK